MIMCLREVHLPTPFILLMNKVECRDSILCKVSGALVNCTRSHNPHASLQELLHDLPHA